MIKIKIYYVAVILSLAALLSVGCAGITITPTPSAAPPPTSSTPAQTPPSSGVTPSTPPATTTPVSQEESQSIAEEFVRNSPTFVFDGIEDSLKLVHTETLRCPFCWQFTFEFQSRHAGYGDRTGQALAQVITTHQAVITVMQGQVTYAVIDKEWDIIKQAPISK